MYGNIDSKIDGYGAKYPFLDAGYRLQIHSMCQTFIEGYDKTDENRATARQMSQWFENIGGQEQAEKSDPFAARRFFRRL